MSDDHLKTRLRKAFQMELPYNVDDLCNDALCRITDLEGAVERLQRALRLLDGDMHRASPRPCATCREVSARAGFPFGCERRQR